MEKIVLDNPIEVKTSVSEAWFIADALYIYDDYIEIRLVFKGKVINAVDWKIKYNSKTPILAISSYDGEFKAEKLTYNVKYYSGRTEEVYRVAKGEYGANMIGYGNNYIRIPADTEQVEIDFLIDSYEFNTTKTLSMDLSPYLYLKINATDNYGVMKKYVPYSWNGYEFRKIRAAYSYTRNRNFTKLK